MGDLKLSGQLNFIGKLDLKGDGGKVKVAGQEALLKGEKGVDTAHGIGIPVILPPPPAPPTDPGTDVWVFNTFNSTVKVNGSAVVTLGICAQGNPGMATWPGMVLPSTANTGPVSINKVPINVVGDSVITLPNGGKVTFTASGQ